RYGGDFGDLPNDHICCIDGLVYPDRRLRPGFHDMKITYQPFTVTYDNGTITVMNKRYFESLDDLGFKWTIEKNGKVINEGVVDKTEIAARAKADYKLFDDIQADEFTTLNIRFFQNSDTLWAEKGSEVGYVQFILSDSAISIETNKNNAVSFDENRTAITINCGDTTYTFDKILGKVVSINNGKELLSEPISFNVNRSYHISNDCKDQWKRARYEQVKQKTYSSEITEASDEKIVITTKTSFAAAAMPPAIRADIVYTFTADGKLNISVKSVVTYNAPALPKFGIKLVMPEGFENVTYLGYGPDETYADRFISQMISEYSTTATDAYEHYIRPQECSSHYKTKTASVKDADGNGLAFADTSAEGFCFKAIHYDDEQIHATRHDDELTALNETIVSLDYKMHCDNLEYANLEPWRKFEEKEFAFSYDIIPE
ncbi:MAG: beta-galactosidase domain 4-containing protein, partial [Acutalibacteraceae bacterium]|nr:beta-galactosidase domain 4-containing protein [Acutalibacteraceae bacterium]